MEVQRRAELVLPAASAAGWQSVGVIATSILEGYAADSVSFEAVSGEDGPKAAAARPRADRPGRRL